MSQFRTTADILDEVLRKSGEPTNGNSVFERDGRLRTYTNRAHHVIIGGGNIFNINVDEPWVWARAHQPIVLELQPAFTSGYLTCLSGDTNVIFSSAAATSLEGWYLQVRGKPAVYRITSHAAAGTVAQVDSSFLDDSGIYTFRAFRLDYPIFPAYLYVDGTNDKLDFQESSTARLTATLDHGSYTPANLASNIASKLSSVGTATYGLTWDTAASTFTVTSNFQLSLLGATGANARRSALQLLGFDYLDQTGAQSYTSAYQPNQVARLIEPFKTFSYDWPERAMCYSSDTIRMQEDYPIARVAERFPERFARISEDQNGVIWVRFSSYPKSVTKLQCDWIPQPIDLQDNTASFVRVPRGDVDTLIHAASAFILYDKTDSKLQGCLEWTGKQLDAMKKKNHDLLLRTGNGFGQVTPRPDLDRNERRLNYGYTVNGSTAQATTAQTAQAMIAATLSYSQFQTASTVSAVVATTLAANRTLFALIVKHSQVFTGSGVTGLSLNVGTAASPTQFINSFNPAQPVNATAQDSALVLYFPAVSTPIQVQLVSTGANLANLTSGSVTIYFQEQVTQ